MSLRIPLQFIRSKLGRTSWRDLEFGLRNDLLDPGAVRELADLELRRPDAPAAALQIVVADDGEPVDDLVAVLASAETDGAGMTKRRWLFLVLAWLLDH